MKITREPLHVRLLVNETAVENIVERRSLALAGLVNGLLQGGQIGTTRFTGRLKKELGHACGK
jgi:hypothetical protein